MCFLSHLFTLQPFCIWLALSTLFAQCHCVVLQGGFVSTQDTVVALQALSVYAQSVSQDPTDLSVQVGNRFCFYCIELGIVL